MIHLDQGQTVAEHPELVVFDVTGDYDDHDMILCAKADDSSNPYCRFEAQFIAYGGVVYSISDDTQLTNVIDQMDPDNTLNDPTDNSLVTPDTTSTTTVPTNDTVITPPDPAIPTPPPPVDTSTSTSTTTPPVTDSTTTPDVIPDTIPDATTTPLDIDPASTTTSTTTATSTP